MNKEISVHIDDSEETRQLSQGKLSLDGEIVLFVLRRAGFDWKLEFRDASDEDFRKPPLFTAEGYLKSDDMSGVLHLDLAFANIIFDSAERYFMGSRCRIGQPVDYRRLGYVIGAVSIATLAYLIYWLS